MIRIVSVWVLGTAWLLSGALSSLAQEEELPIIEEEKTRPEPSPFDPNLDSEDQGKMAVPAWDIPFEFDHLLFPAEKLKPYDLPPIPDDPPPHEGRMFDLPYLVEPPDLIRIEIIEGLPGRPITGERLVRPDGTVSLDFYGDLHVRGLTLMQIKMRVIQHMRQFLPDEKLGLIEMAPNFDPVVLPERPELPTGLFPPPAGIVPDQDDDADPVPGAELPEDPCALLPFQVQNIETPPGLKVIPPAESDRVFVDVSSYNSKVYFVYGDVVSPGRLVWTGNETVLDALNYSGGMLPVADMSNLQLIRPAQGNQPPRVYPIDFEVIVARGESAANLQIFPGDRLIVGRDPIVNTNIWLNRVSEPFSNMVNRMQTYADAMKALIELGEASTAEQREQIAEAWVDLWLTSTSEETRGEIDPDALRETMIRLLTPPIEP